MPGFNLVELVQQVSYVGLFLMVFAESGLFFGFFLPGDSLLFTTGFLAAQGLLNIWVLVPLLTAGAILGDSAGYWTGNRLGSWLLKRKESWFFQKKHLIQAQEFYAKHGGKTLILARFIPAVRTFAPIVAGMAKMEYGRFLSFNVIGGLGWAAGMTLAGYFLGSLIPGVDKYLLPIVGGIILVSISPGLIHFLRKKK
ncbi:MAG: hypothetical protein A2784_01055 [Candidatus Chisholmbacteria bacterium RIFCSPHIGHO2_01_FULL_48_12]|uniref:VTT domain-containing protein n=1 Tax=Candidatus Chisholmbacteria bacterium RIFCSPHIGHO2_01_FULL_48_12 TaxID=1797589 RepID=A0A1G1VJQ0_9BACT|nr:MAG: hypothetical protein A2784_01055 [Candidatus Chisholmbacteria bacterium RIFCSPHIGHO2_01_FULL_48_12]